MENKEIRISFVLANAGTEAARDFEKDLKQKVIDSGNYEVREMIVEPGQIYAAAFDWSTLISGLAEGMIVDLAIMVASSLVKALKDYRKNNKNDKENALENYLVIFSPNFPQLEKISLDDKSEEEITNEILKKLKSFKKM